MQKWTPFPHLGDYAFNASSLKKCWSRLHASDREPYPQESQVVHAWLLFHHGEFQQAAQAGLKAGGAGITVANKATSIYANHLEPEESVRLALFWQVAERAAAQAELEPDNVNAWFWQAYALGRYSEGISVAKALAQGLGSRVRDTLEKTIRLEPRHADAHIALGAFHAEVIDKVGSLIGCMTYGAKKETGMKLYQNALALNPDSAFAMTEYANALVMMEGDKRLPEAAAWYQKAAACQPLDATERLDVELAKAELAQR
jgi:tetratricopeptide (TPR) repeat protein